MFLQSAPIVEHFILPPIPFIPMVFPVVMISYLMFKLKDIFIPLLEIVPKTIDVVLLLFNPKKFIDDLIFAITYGIKSVVGGMMSSMDSGTKSNNEEKDPYSGPKVCMSPSIFNLIALVLCPPLSIMLNSEDVAKGIFKSIICAILTVWCYYFPGLIYAALHILC